MIEAILTTLHSRERGRAVRAAISVSLLGGITALSLMGVWTSSKSHAPMTADDVARQFCVLPPPEAQVKLQDFADREVSVPVPNEVATYNFDSSSVVARKGDVVKLTVSSQRAGAVGVHGLSTIDAVRAGESVVIRFRAIYSGRFPLHFHGTDGSHFELIAINITADAGDVEPANYLPGE